MNLLGVSALPELLCRLFGLIYTWLWVAYNCAFLKTTCDFDE